MSRATVGSAAQHQVAGLRTEIEELKRQNKNLWAVIDWVAAVSGKTFARKGDSAMLADDEAHHKILDKIREELGEEVITRNQDRKLTSFR